MSGRFGRRGSGIGTELFWVTGGGSVDSYIIYCGTSSGSYNQSDDVGLVTNIKLASTSFSLARGTTYYAIVRAVLGGVEGSDSNEICFIYRGAGRRCSDC